NGALKLAAWRSKANFSEVAPVRLIPNVKGKVMVISAGGDPLVTPDQMRRLAEAVKRRANSRDVCWRVEEAFHVESLAARPQEYRRMLESFLAEQPQSGDKVATPLVAG